MRRSLQRLCLPKGTLASHRLSMGGDKHRRRVWRSTPTAGNVSLRNVSPGMLAPGATIGILGGGQLGRMTALAAARLGYRCHVFTNEADSPAAQVCATATVAEFTDLDALERFAATVDLAT